MGQLPVYGGASGGAGRRGVSDLFRGRSSANSVPLMAPRLDADRVDGQEAEAGLLAQVLRCPTALWRCQRSESLLPGGDRFPLRGDSGLPAETGGVCTAARQRERVLLRILSWFPRRREVSCPF